MKGSHVFNLHQSAIINGAYSFDNVEKSTIETIVAARIWRNLGRKAAAGYAAKRGLNMGLVRLACQLEAMRKHGFILGGMYNMKSYDDVNGQIIGGEYGLCWVTYEGRKQGSTGFPTNELEAEKFCQKVVDRIKKDCGEHFSSIYPNEHGWRFHFDGV